MDLSEELALLRQRLDALERQVVGQEQPGDPGAALVVSTATLPEGTDVARWTVQRVVFEETEGASASFTATGAILAPGLGSCREGSYFVAVPVQGSRFVTIF